MTGKRAATTRPVNIAVRERAQKALEIRKTGANFDDIARRAGYANRSGAYKAVRDAMDRITQEPAEAVLKLELERLDALLAAYWGKALGGDVQAFDRVLRVMERRARYLGLDAPVRTDVSSDGVLQVLFHPALAPHPVVESGEER